MSSHKTGEVTCLLNTSLIIAGSSECGRALTFEITGIRGGLISMLLRSSESLGTAGLMNSV